VTDKGTTFESGTAGSAVTTSNPPTSGADTAFGTVTTTGTGSATVVNTDHSGTAGTKCMECAQTSTASSSAFGLYGGFAATTVRFKFKFKYVTSVPSGDIVIMRSFNSSAVRWLSIAKTTTNKLELRLTNSDTVTYTSTATIAADTWYRVEGSVTLGSASNATVNIQWYVDDSTTPRDSGLAVTNGNTGTSTAVADFRYGIVSSTSIQTLRIDSIQNGDASLTFYGPDIVTGSVSAVAATTTAAAPQPVVTGDSVLSGGGAAIGTTTSPAPVVAGGAVVTATAATVAAQAPVPLVDGQQNVTVLPPAATASVGVPNAPTVVATSATFLFTPPQWRQAQVMEGALRYSIPVSTVVYRTGGVWHNQMVAGIDDPAKTADVDPSGLLLFFTRPTVIPLSLFADISANALTPADPSWSPGTLTPVI